MLDQSSKSGAIETQEVKMIRTSSSSRTSRRKTAHDPRIYMFSRSTAINACARRKNSFSNRSTRAFPLYEGTLDNIIGILYKTKALTALAQGIPK